MSCFGKRCVKKKPKKIPAVEHINQKLGETETLLNQQQEDLEKQIEECIATAKTNASTNKRTAMRALQKKKRLEKTLQQVDQVLINLEVQRNAIENNKTNAVVVASMKMAGELLKKSNIKLNLGNVQDLMHDINEQEMVGREIGTVICGSLLSEGDHEELAKELKSLIQDQNKAGEPCSSILSKLPSVPADDVFATPTMENYKKKCGIKE